MRWRRRLLRLAKWLSAAAAAVLIIAWLATLLGWIQWVPSSGRHLVCNSRGSLVIDWIRPYKYATDIVWIPHNVNAVGLSHGPYLETKPLQSEWHWRPRLIRKEGFRRAVLYFPLWIPIAAVIGACLFLHWRDRAWSYRGWCYRCDYDCRGLPESSVCPECARPRLLRKRRASTPA